MVRLVRTGHAPRWGRASVRMVLLTTIAALSRCAVTPATPESPDTSEQAVPTVQRSEPVVAEGSALPADTGILDNAREELSLGRYATAMRLYAELAQRSPETAEGRQAQAALDALSSDLLLEPSAEWLGVDGAMVNGRLRDLLAGTGPVPSLIVTIAQGPARVAVHALPVRFTAFWADSAVRTSASDTASSDGDALAPVCQGSLLTSELGTASYLPEVPDGMAGRLDVHADAYVATTSGDILISRSPLVFSYAAPAARFLALCTVYQNGESRFEPGLMPVFVQELQTHGSVREWRSSVEDTGPDTLPMSPESLDRVLVSADALLLAHAALVIDQLSQVSYQGRAYDIWTAEGHLVLTVVDGLAGRTIVSGEGSIVHTQANSEQSALSMLVTESAESLRMLVRENAMFIQAASGDTQ